MLRKFLSVTVLVTLAIFGTPAMAAMLSVVVTGTVSEVIDPDGLLPFDSLVVGQTQGMLTFQYDDQITTTTVDPSAVALYWTWQPMTMKIGSVTVTKSPMIIRIFNDFESPPGEYQDAWSATASSRQFNDPAPDILHLIHFFMGNFTSTQPVLTLDSTDLIKPEWPDGWSTGQFQYSVLSQPQGTLELNVLAKVTLTLESVSVVPIPTAVWLFGSALGLLGWLRRKPTGEHVTSQVAAPG